MRRYGSSPRRPPTVLISAKPYWRKVPTVTRRYTRWPTAWRSTAATITGTVARERPDRRARSRRFRSPCRIEYPCSRCNADTGSKDAVLQATTAYVNDTIPTVTDALDAVDPSVVHD